MKVKYRTFSLERNGRSREAREDSGGEKLVGQRNGFGARKAGSMNPLSEIFSLPSRCVRHWAPHSDRHGASELGSELGRKLQRPLLEIIARNCRWPAVARAAGLTLQVSENPIDDYGIGDDGDLCGAST